MDRAMLTLDEFAAILGVSARTVRRLVKAETCPVAPRRVGGVWRWSKIEVDRYLDGGEAVAS